MQPGSENSNDHPSSTSKNLFVRVGDSQNSEFIHANDLSFVSKNLKNLEQLGLVASNRFYSGFNGKFIYFENLERLQVDVPASLPIRFASDKLERLKLILKEENIKFPYDYIEKYPTIRQLFLHGKFGYFEEVNMPRIASLLPLLERIIFDSRVKISINEVIPHLTKFQSRKGIHFYNLEHVEYHDLMPLLIDGWSIDKPIENSVFEKYEINLKRKTGK